MYFVFDKRICLRMIDIIFGMYLYRFSMMMFILFEELFIGVFRDLVGYGEESRGLGEEEVDIGLRIDRLVGWDIIFYF